MPSLSPPTGSLSRRTTRLLIAVSVLAALVALPRAHASTPPAAAAAPASGRPPVAAAPPAPIPIPAAKMTKATTVASTAPTCQAIMRRLSGSLAATPSTADKPGTVMIDVDKAGVMMACSHSDSIAIPVPGGKPR
ncbi:glycoprotein [Ralstonia sp. CHL-2022]|uniref:Glycoprotein n=1 Tax=Ralstonia mojiangensis TaxID=2953895 RepID=A0ABT2LAW1_9RALS|nr:glycoprotein [Ralstonia mojiangensis]MCT7298231.1 glycoprotein [Ralstonia mojiangensis]MCT7312570.1 glycoprotein [Ralstonia mojiangensis]